jgi:hypothetical protein
VGLERRARDPRRPQRPAVEVSALEHERRRAQRHPRVHDRAAADHRPGEHVEARVAATAEERRLVARVHTEQVVGGLALAEIGVGDPHAALEHQHPQARSGVPERGDRAAEPRAHHRDVDPLGHQRGIASPSG